MVWQLGGKSPRAVGVISMESGQGCTATASTCLAAYLMPGICAGWVPRTREGYSEGAGEHCAWVLAECGARVSGFELEEHIQYCYQ